MSGEGRREKWEGRRRCNITWCVYACGNGKQPAALHDHPHTLCWRPDFGLRFCVCFSLEEEEGDVIVPALPLSFVHLYPLGIFYFLLPPLVISSYCLPLSFSLLSLPAGPFSPSTFPSPPFSSSPFPPSPPPLLLHTHTHTEEGQL